jgi:Tfp pilus assembly protein PilF
MSAKVDDRFLKIYCPAHKISFTHSRAKKILCEIGGHSLARNFPQDYFWEYCCDCQNFWPSPLAFGARANNTCPVCSRDTARRFVCAKCKVVSIESDTHARRKQFSILPNEPVSPSCPGCYNIPLHEVGNHVCDLIEACFLTDRTQCPFCDQNIDSPPTFPARNADYLHKIGADKIRVSDDLVTGNFMPSSSGEFILIPDGNGSQMSILLPAVTQFSTILDFFLYYDKYYICDNPTAGDVVIISPAIVITASQGWQLQRKGYLKVVEPSDKAEPNHSGEKPASDVAHQPVEATEVIVPAVVEKIESTPVIAAFEESGGTLNDQSGGLTSVDRPVESAEAKTKQEASINEQTPTAKPKICKTCGGRLSNKEEVCSTCEAPELLPDLNKEIHIVEDAQSLEDNSVSWLNKRQRLLTYISIPLICLAVIYLFVLAFSRSSIERQLDKAIAEKKIFEPQGSSARDYYVQLKEQGTAPDTLSKYEQQLYPLLMEQPLALLADYYQTGSSSQPVAQWEEATKRLQWVVEIKPAETLPKAQRLFCIGFSAYLKGDKEAALEAWKLASDLDTNWAMATNGLGVIYNERNNYVKARAYLLEAVKRDSTWAVPNNNIGISFFQHGNQDNRKAEQYFRDAKKFAPSWSEPRYWLGKIALQRGDYELAEKEFQAALLAENSIGRDKFIKEINEALKSIRRRPSLAK